MSILSLRCERLLRNLDPGSMSSPTLRSSPGRFRGTGPACFRVYTARHVFFARPSRKIQARRRSPTPRAVKPRSAAAPERDLTEEVLACTAHLDATSTWAVKRLCVAPTFG